MSNVKATDIPQNSKLFAEKNNFDWFDAYQIELDDPEGKLTSWRVCETFLNIIPFWVRLLFAIRNLTVSCVGLKTAQLSPNDVRKYLKELESLSQERFPLDVGVANGKIYSTSDTEIAAGANDWHLDFKGSIFVQKKDCSKENSDNSTKKSVVTATTLVRFKHWFGRLYFLLIKPFHKLIVRCLLARLVRHWNRDRC